MTTLNAKDDAPFTGETRTEYGMVMPVRVYTLEYACGHSKAGIALATGSALDRFVAVPWACSMCSLPPTGPTIVWD